VCQWFLTGFYCSTKLGEIPDMAKSWATFCCPGCYKVISKMCCGFKDIRNIILGGGQDLLSPERRFDAVLVNSPDIFI
ncbi:MAG: HindVP family restriction endonuclease, partial [Muribaculaceae bacterium]|nr:HindVP family restriction endonuclease [Muribaculaceae bacterium]